ncbi:cation:proton antiporter regulatory subunit [Actinomyces minihominis]|uniref:cation:proton antiporter regulatory subunit n=1 Tax=Actinomyces minihominis TaxID=2002838 RepID=UPI0013ECF615|nr:cation:proton antiporter regulatory subunit [Actinomyces minihominis]
MPHNDGIYIEESELPGIGLRDDFLTSKGLRVGVITHRDGHRDLLVYKKGDPDSVSETISLTEGEADTLAEYLGTRRVVQRLSRLTDAIDDLEAVKVKVNAGDYMANKTLGEGTIRTDTGASIVAVWHNKEVTTSPMPDYVIRPGDILVLVGSEASIAAAREIINGV